MLTLHFSLFSPPPMDLLWFCIVGHHASWFHRSSPSNRFMEDLQAEVQEMEFLQFSKGMDTMRREDFAEWLLHYTNEEDNDAYWENMRKRIPAGEVQMRWTPSRVHIRQKM